MNCSNCYGAEEIIDERRGEVICKLCGLVKNSNLPLQIIRGGTYGHFSSMKGSKVAKTPFEIEEFYSNVESVIDRNHLPDCILDGVKKIVEDLNSHGFNRITIRKCFNK